MKSFKMISMKHLKITNEQTLSSKSVPRTSPRLARHTDVVQWGLPVWRKPSPSCTQAENQQDLTCKVGSSSLDAGTCLLASGSLRSYGPVGEILGPRFCRNAEEEPDWEPGANILEAGTQGPSLVGIKTP